jgi:hypothetical protein
MGVPPDGVLVRVGVLVGDGGIGVLVGTGVPPGRVKISIRPEVALPGQPHCV